jgi:hypothetical protein
MSVENRKAMYDGLLAAGREDHIDPALLKEFGKPKLKKTKLKTIVELPNTKEDK